MPELKVLHISAAGTDTGAGKGALNLHSALFRNNVSSRLLLLTGSPAEPAEVFSFSDTLLRRALRFTVTTLDRIPTWWYPQRERQIFSPGIFGLSLLSHPLVKWADIIHLHWVNHGFIRLKELTSFNKPVVWTMHDMWPFTGGCHHSFSCDRFTAACGKCPRLRSSCETDLSNRCLREKQKWLPAGKINWVAISSWMAESAAKSSLLKDSPIKVVPSGIDAVTFKPKDRGAARQALGLPLEKRIILLGADNLLSPYKGIQFSLEALRAVDAECVIVTFGNARLPSGLLPQSIVHLGYVSDLRKLAGLYSAADLFLATSVAEAFGMTVAEAQCCGVPVVAFNSGGPRDIVAHKITGYLAETGSVPDLVSGINCCLSTNWDTGKIGKRAAELFSIDNCALKYLEHYRECLRLS